jgi:uncharacterized membrane protein YdbT with pleckstrin-like domain
VGAYIYGNLLPDERVVAEAKMHWVVFLRPLLIIFFSLILISSVPPLGIILLIIGIVYLGISALVSSTTEMAVTNKRVIGKTGIISRNLFDTHLTKVEGAQLHQRIIGRILGYGSIVISGTGSGRQTYHKVSDPISF